MGVQTAVSFSIFVFDGNMYKIHVFLFYYNTNIFVSCDMYGR